MKLPSLSEYVNKVGWAILPHLYLYTEPSTEFPRRVKEIKAYAKGAKQTLFKDFKVVGQEGALFSLVYDFSPALKGPEGVVVIEDRERIILFKNKDGHIAADKISLEEFSLLSGRGYKIESLFAQKWEDTESLMSSIRFVVDLSS